MTGYRSPVEDRVDQVIEEAQSGHSSADPLVHLVWLIKGMELWHRTGGAVGHSPDQVKRFVVASVLNVWGEPPRAATTETPSPAGKAGAREWCHARHICHHWFEDECSVACDRGEHRGGHGHPGCADRNSPISSTEEKR